MDPIDIPLHEVDEAGPILLIEEEPERLADLVSCALAAYGPRVIAAGDALSRRWLARSDNPYLPEIAAIADLAVPKGAYLLNLSYEWSCTVGLFGPGMLRTLDWPLAGLGRTVVVARQTGAAGKFYNVTWPGFVGVLTAMAPGRFSAAINQAPLRRFTGIRPLDWGLERLRLLSTRELPPSHLLRRAFETCASFAEAQEFLATQPLAMPAFFSLSGTKPEECCILLRSEYGAKVIDGPGAVANHWPDQPKRGYARGLESEARLEAMGNRCSDAGGGFAWLTPPIVNETTRLAVTLDARAGTLSVLGLEADGPATKVFDL